MSSTTTAKRYLWPRGVADGCVGREVSANFERLVFGSIEAMFCKYRRSSLSLLIFFSDPAKSTTKYIIVQHHKKKRTFEHFNPSTGIHEYPKLLKNGWIWGVKLRRYCRKGWRVSTFWSIPRVCIAFYMYDTSVLSDHTSIDVNLVLMLTFTSSAGRRLSALMHEPRNALHLENQR